MWVKYHSGWAVAHQLSQGVEPQVTNLVQLICRPLTLEVKLESESDRMDQGLNGIQTLCLWYA